MALPLVGMTALADASEASYRARTDFTVGAEPYSVAIGDLNGDGHPDLVTANAGSGNVSVLLGTGTGSFGAATNFGVGSEPTSVAIGDLNGDGHPDLVVANQFSRNVSVLLGTGTGSFGAATNIPVGNSPDSVAIGDLNGDGHPDLVVANGGSGNVSVLLGTGTGSFGAATNFGVGTEPGEVAIGDLNGDGHPDLVVANTGSPNVSVLLGTGTGTGSFGAATDFGVGGDPTSVAIGDLNGDGRPDLAAVASNVSVLLGTGTGSFGAATDFGVGGDPISVAIGDLNGDGKLDVAAANFSSNNVSVLPGAGTGSFGAATSFGVGTQPTSVAIGDLNGDGYPDLVVANRNAMSSGTVSVLLSKLQAIDFLQPAGHTLGDPDFEPGATASSGLPVTYVSQTTGVCTITAGGYVHLAHAGTCTVTAEQAGDADYDPATAVTRSFAVASRPQTINFPAIADHTLGEADFEPGATASSGLAVTYTSQTTSVCTILSGKVHLVAPGECTVTVEQGGDLEYEAASPASRSFQVAPEPQTIIFGTPPSHTLGEADFDTDATASSGLVITYSSADTSVCTILSGKVHLVAPGECEISAEQGGDADYDPAAPVTRSFHVAPRPQTIAFPAIADHTLGDPDFEPGAAASSGLPVTYTSQTTSVCTVVSGKVHLVSSGECTVTVEQGGDLEYAPAAAVARSFQVAGEPGETVVATRPAVAPAAAPSSVDARIVLLHTPNTPHRPDAKSGPHWTFVFTDAAPGMSYRCRMDGRPWRRCSSPTAYRNLARGVHVFRLRSVDVSGEGSSVETVRFRAGKRG
ncbi:MAG TPA: VCBS repeat-containing protein [Solirubrobacterales bacterium]